MLSRQEAFELLSKHVDEEHLIHHSLATEAVMRGLAARLGRDEELWGVAGLLHDLDYSRTKDTPEQHGLAAAEMLEGRLPEEAVYAIRAHNDMNGTEPKSEFDFALRCGETVTGMISASALVRPTRMEGMKPKSLKKKMKDKAFARNINRGVIRECEKLGLELGEFFQISIDSMTKVADQVGLA